MVVAQKQQYKGDNVTYKILHFSDLHLDTSFAGQGFSLGFGVERRLDLRACLTKILARARDLKVDAVTIGGDLFNHEYLQPETAEFIQQQFALLAPIRVIIAPGGKDTYTSDSPYARLNWSDNVDIFYQRKLTCLELSADIHLWGACNPPPTGHKLFDDFTPANGVNILLLHGVQSSNNNDIYNINNEVVKNTGFTFALLGGEHIANNNPPNQSICIYPGTPEPLNQSEENGLHQIVSIDITGHDYISQSYEIQQWHYREKQLDITKYSSIVETARQISNLLEKENGKASRTAVSVQLKGCPQFDLNLSTLRELIQSKVFFHIESHISMNYDIEQLSHEQTVRGLLVNHFQERLNRAMTESERNKELTALNIALQVLEGKQVSLYEIKEN